MKLNFEIFPLNVYQNTMAISLLKEIDSIIPQIQHSRLSISQYILSSFVKKVAGGWAASLIDNVVIGSGGVIARNCLADLIHNQINRINCNPSLILKETQLNLMASCCVTDYLSHLECSSIGSTIRVVAKTALSMLRNLSFRRGLEEINNEVIEISEKYDDICQVYHIAFLLNVYCSNQRTKEIVIKLITESLCNDNQGILAFSSKKRPVLFSNFQYKTLEDVLQNKLDFLITETKNIKNLYDSFIKGRKELNDEYRKLTKNEIFKIDK